MENQVLDDAFQEIKERRRKLLPWWIRFFTWVYMIFGVIAPLGLIAGIAGWQFNLSIYGLSTVQPLSIIGLVIICLFILNGLAAFGLWLEKDWAILYAKAAGYTGIVVCIFTMFIMPSLFPPHDNSIYFVNGSTSISIRLELALLTPFVIRLSKIQREWKLRGFSAI